MAEIAFEQFLGAIEETRGTAITTPTHLLNTPGVITPKKHIHRPKESRGTLAAAYRSAVTRKWSEWETGESDADPNELLFWLNMGVKPVTSPTTPTNGVLTRLWAFVRAMTSDDLKSATLYGSDPNLQVFRVDFAMLDELVLSNDAASEDGVLTFNASGMAGFPTAVSDPTVPASIAGGVLPGQEMQLWIDTSSAIGTTAISGRLLSATHTIRTGVKYKYVAAGPTTTFEYSLIGREQVMGVTTQLKFEVPDLTQYNNWANHDTLKCRVRHNGSLIESVTPDYYQYVEVDTYGPFDAFAWGENETSNRTIELTIEGEYNSTLGSDCRVAVQCTRTAL